MKKIPTLFERGADGFVTPVFAEVFDFSTATPTEKLDGTNVRLTVRAGTLARLEKRRNPTQKQKADGIIEPWYMDASGNDPADQFIWAAARNTDLTGVPDGEWSGEAVGPKIQGNPLHLPTLRVALFSLESERELLTLPDAPSPPTFDNLRDWLPCAESRYSRRFSSASGVRIEGIVWHWSDGRMVKIKTTDFARSARG